MKTYFLVLSILFSALFFTGCSKGDGVKTKTELLTTGGWRLENKQVKIGAGNWTDVTSGIAACKKDDAISYSTPSTYTVTEGASKCNVADPTTVETGTWAFMDNESKLKVTATSTNVTYNINLITENALTLEEVDASGIVVIYTQYAFLHQ